MTNDIQGGSVDFREFIKEVIAELDLDVENPVPETTLVECGLDSIGMYELMLVLEDMGAVLIEEDILNWQTLADVHSAFLSRPKPTV